MSATEQMRVVVANEPRAYRDVMAGALRRLRPALEVISVEPGELEVELPRHAPALVVYSRCSDVVRASAFAWVLLYPDYQNQATVSIGGRQRTAEDLQFDELLAVVDETARLRHLT